MPVLYIYSRLDNEKGQGRTTITYICFLPHSSAEFLVGHAGIVLFAAPHLSDSLGLDKPEDASLFILPSQESWVKGGIFQQIADEFPQMISF